MSDQLLLYNDPLTRNYDDGITESDCIRTEPLSISDSCALMTLNGMDHNEPPDGADHSVSDAGTDLPSQVDNDALTNYIDGSPEAV